MIFYESPHRIEDTLQSLLEILGDRKVALCREISKKYEEIIRGSITEVSTIVSDLKGEMVLVVDGNHEQEDFSMLSILEHVNLYIEDGLTEKEAIKKVALERDLPKSVVYREYHIQK